MKFKFSWVAICALFFSFLSCEPRSKHDKSVKEEHPTFYPSSKPCTRWWWFATEIKKPDIKYQLDWAKANNFGGVEVAWVYPLHRYKAFYESFHKRYYPADSSAQKWLSPEWSDVVIYTKKYADSIGLSCDFTFGSAWPVAGSNIDKAHGNQIYGDTSFEQLLTFAWTWPENQRVINHLDSNAFHLFADPVSKALSEALKGSKSALFTDSWEIRMGARHKIWTKGFENTFKEKFGYDIIPFMEADLDSFPKVRYDYMLHLEQYVTEGFYKPYVRKCEELGAWSRVQCLAAPADIMNLYGLVDIPETESMLNNPTFSRIVSSAACLASKRIISSETFTDMYGFPDSYHRQEQMADLKMVADAMFAQGVNHHFYHGLPYNPIGSDTIEFFATCYFGPGGSLSPELPEFNSYIEKVSGIMQKGKTYSDVAVYIPYEDAVIKGPLPLDKQRVWVWGEYEMRYVEPAPELEGYHPLWINRTFLETAEFKNGKLVSGDAEFSTLYVDVSNMDIRALKRVMKFAKQGLPICLKQVPNNPSRIVYQDYQTIINQLLSMKNVSNDFSSVVKHKPLLSGDSLPPYWCRVEKDGTHYIFLAQRHAKNLVYPVYSGMSFMSESYFRDIAITVGGATYTKSLEFKPYQSIVLKINPEGVISQENIEYYPSVPVIRPREFQKTFF